MESQQSPATRNYRETVRPWEGKVMIISGIDVVGIFETNRGRSQLKGLG